MKRTIAAMNRSKIVVLSIVICAVAASAARPVRADEPIYDIVVYGDSSGAVTASVAAKRQGHSVILVNPTRFLGGMSASGLGATDFLGQRATFGGIASEFYDAIAAAYGKKYVRSFEPHVGQKVFEKLVANAKVPVVLNERLDREHGVKMSGKRIVSITTLSGKTYRGKMFIDATYVGDLMAAAGVTYTVGREAESKDEFTDNGGWPYMIYIREARRIVADYVMTQHDCEGKRTADDPVGLGSFGMDSHVVQYFVNERGHVRRDGVIWRVPPKPYGISYRSIVPRRGECENLLVPVCLSASHVAHGSIRMEPVFMVLSQSAATAAAHAMDESVAVQDVDYAKLSKRLLADRQVLR